MVSSRMAARSSYGRALIVVDMVLPLEEQGFDPILDQCDI